jgi:hypothetical protein
VTVDELQVLVTANTEDLRKEINKANETIAGLKKSADKSSNGVLSAFKGLKTGIMALGIGNVIKDVITTGMDAIESDSLFSTVMGDNAEAVKSWSDEVSNALGLNAVAMQKNIGVVYNMTSSMGLAEDNALTLAKGVSVLAEDMASFYNLDSEEAFNKLRAGLTGETEPLKALGILIDENTIKQVAYSEGIAENGAELTQQQKVLARYMAIMKQTGSAQGDLARTIDSPSNQYRQLTQQVQKLYISLSNLLMPAVKTILVWLNALARAASEVVNSIAEFFGVTGIGGLSDETQSASQNIGGIGEGLGDANKEAKKLKSSLAGFDEMNVLSEDTGAGADAASGGGQGADMGFSLDEYDVGLGNITDEVEDLTEKAKTFLGIVAGVATAIAGWKIAKAVYNFFKNPAELGFFKKMGDLFGVTDELGALTTGDKFSALGGALLTVAGAASFAYGAFDSLSNGVDWGNLAFMMGGVAAAAGGLFLAIKPFNTTLAPVVAGIVAVAGGVAMLVIGIVDFINNGPTLQNTLLIVGGAIAVAIGLATAGISALVSVIVGVVSAIAAFTAAIILEDPAIMSVTEAQENLTAAKERAKEAENSYINAVDAAEASLKKLQEAEEKAGITGAELYAQVQAGTLDYKDMTAEQREVYKAYLDNEQKQKDLVDSTNAFNEAKKAETIASYENELALAKESGSYDEFKKSIVDAFEKGELSADEARDLIAKSMSEMSDEAQQTFMQDLPSSLQEGLDPHKYESTGTKITKWFGGVWEGIKEVFSKVGSFFSDIFSKAWEKVVGVFSHAGEIFVNIKDGVINVFKKVVNGLIDGINTVVSLPFKGLNGILDTLHGLNILGVKPFGWLTWRAPVPQLPKLARGGIVDRPTYAMIGEAGREAVIPLERNLGYLDKLAEIIAEKIGGGGGDIHLVVKLGEDKIFDKFIEYSKDKAFETGEVVFA